MVEVGVVVTWVLKTIFWTAASFALGALARMLVPKPKTGQLSNQARSQTVMIRGSAEPQRLIYGVSMTSGPLVLSETTGGNNELLHLTLALAGHLLEEITTVFLEDTDATDVKYKETGNVNSIEVLDAGDPSAGIRVVVDVNSIDTGSIADVFGAGDEVTLAGMSIAGYDGDYNVSGTPTVARFTIATPFVGTATGTWQQQKLYLNKHLGGHHQAADSRAVAAITDYTSVFTGADIAYIYLQLIHDPNIWITGLPNVKAKVKGKRVWDPRVTPVAITSSSVADPTIITTTAVHGLTDPVNAENPQIIFISGHGGTGTEEEELLQETGEFLLLEDATNVLIEEGSAEGISSVPDLDGYYTVKEVLSTTTFSIDVAVTTGGTGGNMYLCAYSNNAALCQLDYLVTIQGMRFHSSQIDFTSWQAAANACDESVTVFSTVNIWESNLVNPVLVATLTPHGLVNGATVTIADHGNADLNGTHVITWVSTTTFTIPVDGSVSGPGGQTGTVIRHGDAGAGVQKRYTCDGVVFLNQAPSSIIDDLLTASAGSIVFQGGKYYGYAGEWTAATGNVIVNDNLRGNISITTKPPRNSLFNAIKGIFVDEDNYYQPTDFPPITSATYETEDGGVRLYRDTDFPFTTNVTRAQRLAKIMLLRARLSTVAKYPVNLMGMEYVAHQVAQITNSDLSWTAKNFRVLSWVQGEDLGIDLTLQEEESTVYDWSPGDETFLPPPAASVVPDPYTVAAPTGLTLTVSSLASNFSLLLESNEYLLQEVGHRFLLEDNNELRFDYLYITWDAVTDVLVLSGGRFEIQSKLSSETWPAATVVYVPGIMTGGYISAGAQANPSYDVRVRAINSLGVTSVWTVLVA